MSPSAQERHDAAAVDVGGNAPIEAQSMTDTAAEEGTARAGGDAARIHVDRGFQADGGGFHQAPLWHWPAARHRRCLKRIERIGFFALSHRVLCALAFVVLCSLAAIGFARVKVDDSLSQLFRSDTAEYKTYAEITRHFPSNEFDVLIVIEGDRLLERPSLQNLRDLVIGLQLLDGTRGLISIFSAREPPEGNQIPAPLFPNPLPQGADHQRLMERMMANEIIRGKLLSADGKLALMVLALDPAATGLDRLSGVVGTVRKELTAHLAGTGLKGELSGVPVMQLEIRNAIQRDRLIYNALGFAIGCLIAIIFFRRLSFMIIAAVPPLAAILPSRVRRTRLAQRFCDDRGADGRFVHVAIHRHVSEQGRPPKAMAVAGALFGQALTGVLR